MRKQSTLVMALCALVAAGPALAGDYDDTTEGNWNSNATWGESDAWEWPATAGDTAVVDTVKVTVPGAATIPALTSLTLGGSGHLYITPGGAVTPTVTLTGGGKIEGGYVQNVDLDGGLNVTGGTSTLQPGTNGSLTFDTNPIASTTDNCTLEARSYSTAYRGAVKLATASPDYSGQWLINNGGSLRVQADGGLGTGTVTVDGGELRFETADQTGTGPAALDVYRSAGDYDLVISVKTVDYANDPVVTLHENARLNLSNGAQWNDPVHVAGNCRLVGYKTCYLAGPISSDTSNVKITYSGAYGTVLKLSGDNAGYTGDLQIDSYPLHLTGPRAHGSMGTITVTGGTDAVLKIDTDPDPTLPQPRVVVDGGAFEILKGRNPGWDVTLTAGGELRTAYTWSVTHDGTIELAGSGKVRSAYGGALTVAGQITGEGKLLAEPNTGKIVLSCPTNDYTGGTDVVWFSPSYYSHLEVTDPGALSSGTVTLTVHNAGNPDLVLAKAGGPDDWELTNNLAGLGEIKVEDGSYALTCQGSKILPGFASPLTISGTVNLTSGSGPATLYAGISPAYSTPTVFTLQNRKLVVDGNVSLAGGKLRVDLSDATGTLTLPDVQGQVFTVLECDEDLVTSGDRFGEVEFGSFGGFELGGPVEYGYDAGTTTGTVTVEVTIKADADCNLLVDVLDLAAIANNFDPAGTGKGWRDGDFNHDGKVDVLDLAILANNFNKDARGAGGDGAPVPEPATLAVLALGGAVLIRRRRR